ncbi:DGQHR domain-containing protein [Shewanella sp. SR44-4]|uniref:DGQHR domain-containing protein n=1 Tax=Shewanella sp. SR44-4 TaxID=2760935 RepID=UPI0015FF2717|nr:DGQHR domain-containing protein [Shewanella sp. SR44-4]MBB1361061.1 DGQHR domain-containing protein [Shewanella sp. SR44-4]
MIKFPLKIPAIKVDQPLGSFYVASIPAEILLKTCYTIKAEILDDSDDESISYIGGLVSKLRGNQRIRTPKRLAEIKRYSETVDASFPNSIILGANYSEDGNLIKSTKERWDIEDNGEGFYYLNIPTGKKLASIIDGQHRVFGFEHSKAKNMELLCSVYIDLPLAYHARIFTNININQKRVDKNLAYNLFQFDMEQGEPSSWSPETLAVYFARVLASDDKSPLKGMIKLGVINSTSTSSISMASIIDGILSLITSNPKQDRELLHSKTIKDGRSRNMLSDIKTKSPLRHLYLEQKDKTLYDLINHFFTALNKTLWNYDVFRKTLGIHACFDYLKISCNEFDISQLNESFFFDRFDVISSVNFTDEFFGVQTKLRTRLRNVLLIGTGVKTIEELNIKNEEFKSYKKILNLN